MSSDESGHPAIAPGTVKVCGIRTPEDGIVAATAGAGLIGMIFAPARRQVTLEAARAISDAVHDAGTGTRVVGVFVNAPAAEINTAIHAAGLDLVQLNGDEDPALLAELDRPAVKALRAMPGESAIDVATAARGWLDAAVPPIALIVDGYHPTEHGGTGARADWDIVTQLGALTGTPIGVAGGLDTQNVGDAIATVRPLFVDVSSGVEQGGVKDPELIRAFVTAGLAGFGASTFTF